MRSVQIHDKHGKLKRVGQQQKQLKQVASVITCPHCGSILTARILNSLPGFSRFADSRPRAFVTSCSLTVSFIASDALSSTQVVDYCDDYGHDERTRRVGWKLATCTRFTIAHIFSTGVDSFDKLT